MIDSLFVIIYYTVGTERSGTERISPGHPGDSRLGEGRIFRLCPINTLSPTWWVFLGRAKVIPKVESSRVTPRVMAVSCMVPTRSVMLLL